MDHKIYLYKNQDHLGIRNKMRRATGKLEATLPTTEYLVYKSQRWNRRMHGDKTTSQNISTCHTNIGIRNNSLKTFVKRRRSTGEARNHQNYSTTWTKQRSWNFTRIPSNIKVLIAMPYKRSPTTTQKANNDKPKHGASERQIMFFKTKEMLQKARQEKHGSHPTILARWCAQENTEIRWKNTIVTKKKSCFTIVSLLNDMIIQPHELSGYRTPNIGPFVWMLMDPKKRLRQRPEFAAALKQCLKMQNGHLAETQQSLKPIRPEHQQRQRHDQHFEGGENFDYYVDRKNGWRYYREPRRNPPAASSSSTSQWQTSQWQTSWSSWQPTSSEKWWWFRFPGRNSRKSTVSVDKTPTHNTHLCSTVCSQARNAQTTRLAQGPAQELQCHLCALEKSLVIWCVSGLIHGCCLTCLSLRALHLPHSLFLLRHKNTQHNRYKKSISENTQYITHTSPSSLSRQVAPSRITLVWRTAEWRKPAHHNSHKMSTIRLTCSSCLSVDHLLVICTRLQQRGGMNISCISILGIVLHGTQKSTCLLQWTQRHRIHNFCRRNHETSSWELRYTRDSRWRT